MLRRISEVLIIFVLILNFYGCASLSGPQGAKTKEPKLIWNISYVRGVVVAREALKNENIQFASASIDKDKALLKGNYPDSRSVEILITKIADSESNLVARVGNSPTAKEDAQKILEIIAQYSQQPK